MILVRPHGSEPIDIGRDTFGMHARMGEFGFGNFHFYQEVLADLDSHIFRVFMYYPPVDVAAEIRIHQQEQQQQQTRSSPSRI